jgi:hypothetical protein
MAQKYFTRLKSAPPAPNTQMVAPGVEPPKAPDPEFMVNADFQTLIDASGCCQLVMRHNQPKGAVLQLFEKGSGGLEILRAEYPCTGDVRLIGRGAVTP